MEHLKCSGSMKAAAIQVACDFEVRMNQPGIDSRSVTDDEVRMAILVAYIQELEEQLTRKH